MRLSEAHKRLVKKRRGYDVKEIQKVLNSFESYLHRCISDAKRAGEDHFMLHMDFCLKKNKAWIIIELAITNIRTESKIHMDIYRFKTRVPIYKVVKSISEARWILREFLGKEIIRYKIPIPDVTLEKEFLRVAKVTKLR